MEKDFDFTREEMYLMMCLVSEIDAHTRRYADERDLIRRCLKEIEGR